MVKTHWRWNWNEIQRSLRRCWIRVSNPDLRWLASGHVQTRSKSKSFPFLTSNVITSLENQRRWAVLWTSVRSLIRIYAARRWRSSVRSSNKSQWTISPSKNDIQYSSGHWWNSSKFVPSNAAVSCLYRRIYPNTISNWLFIWANSEQATYRVPSTIITGFLGAGKSTLLKCVIDLHSLHFHPHTVFSAGEYLLNDMDIV